MEQQEETLEIRQLTEMGPDETLVTKKYIVHKVRPMKDTLFQISYRYKVSKKEI